VEGTNLVVERRYAAFKYERLPELVAELVRLKPDVIMAGGNPSIAALKHATNTVPVVMAFSIDPVGSGLITSLARPGGNITGMSLTTGPEFIAKQLGVLNEAVPKLSRVGILRQIGRAGAEAGAIADPRHDGRVRGRAPPHRHRGRVRRNDQKPSGRVLDPRGPDDLDEPAADR
jgi:putative ABC transport system substrate-binding protein